MNDKLSEDILAVLGRATHPLLNREIASSIGCAPGWPISQRLAKLKYEGHVRCESKRWQLAHGGISQ
jgi:hypothetical protein